MKETIVKLVFFKIKNLHFAKTFLEKNEKLWSWKKTPAKHIRHVDITRTETHMKTTPIKK